MHIVTNIQADHAELLPDRDQLRRAFDQAVLDIDGYRNKEQLTTPWYKGIGDTLFDTCYSALVESLGYQADNPPKRRPRLYTVSAPAGSGKTSFSIAFAIALVRVAPHIGCLLANDRIKKADELFRDLHQLIPQQVRCWTVNHDKDRLHDETKEDPFIPVELRASKSELRHYPVIVISHACLTGKDSHLVQQWTHGDQWRPRGLCIIDEKIEELNVSDITLANASDVRDYIKSQAANPRAKVAKESFEQAQQHEREEERQKNAELAIEALFRFMAHEAFKADGRNLHTPLSDPRAWTQTEADTQWFNSDEAQAYLRTHSFRHRSPVSTLHAVFAFGRAVASGYALVANTPSTHYVGYTSAHRLPPGSVMLDASSDIDGLNMICPWREAIPCPKATYRDLTVVSVPQITSKRIDHVISYADTKRQYLTWLKDVIRKHVEPGQLALVVVKKALLDLEDIPRTTIPRPEHLSHTFATPEQRRQEIIDKTYTWDFEGRKIATSHWGTGIGSNHWKDAQVVLLFDDYYQPRHVTIATAQGLLDLGSTRGPLKRMKALHSKDEQVDTLWHGHLLRWLKQLALRGRARDYDGHGRCSPQKVVCAVDRDLLLAHVETMFPGCRLIVEGATLAKRGRNAGKAQSHGDRLLAVLTQTDPMVAKVTTKDLEKAMGISWRNAGKALLNQERVKAAWEGRGWVYVPGAGRAPSTFQRCPEQGPVRTSPTAVARRNPKELSTEIRRTKRQLATTKHALGTSDLASLLTQALRSEAA
jgi:hypothetical protein